jgi:anti-anti-sigma factor
MGSLLDIRSVGPDELELVGDLDLSTAPHAKDAFAEIGGPLRLHLGGVRFMDSTGATVLILRQVKTPVILVDASPEVRRVLELMWMERTPDGELVPQSRGEARLVFTSHALAGNDRPSQGW